MTDPALFFAEHSSVTGQSLFIAAMVSLIREICYSMDYPTLCQWSEMQMYLSMQYDDSEPVLLEDIHAALRALPPIVPAILNMREDKQ